MKIEQAVLERLKQVPPDKQPGVLEFVEFLRERNGRGVKPLRSLEGIWADMGVKMTEEDIAQARREMWAIFRGTSRHELGRYGHARGRLVLHAVAGVGQEEPR